MSNKEEVASVTNEQYELWCSLDDDTITLEDALRWKKQLDESPERLILMLEEHPDVLERVLQAELQTLQAQLALANTKEAPQEARILRQESKMQQLPISPPEVLPPSTTSVMPVKEEGVFSHLMELMRWFFSAQGGLTLASVACVLLMFALPGKKFTSFRGGGPTIGNAPLELLLQRRESNTQGKPWRPSVRLKQGDQLLLQGRYLGERRVYGYFFALTPSSQQIQLLSRGSTDPVQEFHKGDTWRRGPLTWMATDKHVIFVALFLSKRLNPPQKLSNKKDAFAGLLRAILQRQKRDSIEKALHQLAPRGKLYQRSVFAKPTKGTPQK